MTGIVVTICLTVGFYVFAVPWLTSNIANKLPDSVYQTAGEQTLEALELASLEPSTLPAARQEQLNQHFKDLISHTPQLNEHGEPKVYVRSWKNVPNAVTLADGTIVVSDELINLLNNDEQLDAVIYHELGHVHHNHVMQSIVKSSLITAGLSLIIGDTNGVADTVSNGAAFAAIMHYSREMETQADEFAAKQLIQKSGNAQALLDAFTVLEKSIDHQNDLKIPTWLGSHPEMPERIEHIRQFDKNSI